MSSVAALWDELNELDDDPYAYLDDLGSLGTSRSPIIFGPGQPLQINAYIAPGAVLTADPSTWAWQDITSRVRYNGGASINVTTGRQDEQSIVAPGRATLVLENTDGALSRRNPTGQWYGLLSRNTPILITVNAGSGAYRAVEMFVNEWPTRWIGGPAGDFTATIVCGGILRRLGIGTKSLQSVMTRSTLTASPAPIGFWALDDAGTGITQYASGLPGGRAAILSGTVPSSGTGPGGVSAMMVMAVDTAFVATCTQLTGTGVTWSLQLLVNPASAPAVDQLMSVVHTLSGTYSMYQIWWVIASKSFRVDVYNPSTTVYTTIATINVANLFSDANPYGKDILFQYTISPSGGNVVIAGGAFSPSQITPSSGIIPFDSTVLVAGITGTVQDVEMMPHLLPTYSWTSWKLAQVSLWQNAVPTGFYRYVDGYTGETAGARILRLCGELGINFTLLGTAADTAAMGPQSIASGLSNLRECEAADGGVLFEVNFGLGYQTRRARNNAPVGLALDINAGHVADQLLPTDDDQKLRNYWSVSRKSGSSSVASDAVSIALEGLYDDSKTLNVSTDTETKYAAYWLLHMGIVNDARWPGIGLNFARTAAIALIDYWRTLPFGSRMTIANPPPTIQMEAIDVFIEGKTERIDQIEWRVSMNCSPAVVNDVFRVEATASLGTTNRGRLGLNQSLAVAVDTTATGWSVQTDLAPLLGTGTPVTDPVNFPQDWVIDGERVTVTAISGAASPQTVTVTRSVNGVVKAHAVGATCKLYRPGVITR